jgi:hypothetical protein
MWALAFVAYFRSGAWRRRLFGSLRVCAYALSIGAVALGFSVRRAKAALSEQSFRLAKELAPIADLLDGATGLRINGQTINFSMSVLPDTTPSVVLGRVEQHCREHPGPLAVKLSSLASQLPENLVGASELRKMLETAALAREEHDGQGAVLCFTGSDATRAAVPENFENPGSDLGELGNLRYVIASRGEAANGEAHLTKVVSLWTEGSFRLDSLSPPPFGDAPGTDSSVLPRPPESTRLLSAEAKGASYAVRIYETNVAPAEVLAFYDRKLETWTSMAPEGHEQRGRGYVKDAVPVIVNVGTDETKTVVTLTELGSAAAAP